MLQIKNLNIFLQEDLRPLIENFNFSVNPVDKVALIGEEGNGKSILLKAIYNENLINNICDISGAVSVVNEKIGYLPQSIEETVLENSTGEYLYDNIPLKEVDYNLFYQLLSDFKFNENLISDTKKIETLSGGERIKFALLVEMLKEPTIQFIY